jgi:primary-amine oxidase
VAYDDHGVRRDVAYRMSIAEMVVPYRDPTFDHYRRTAYDIGEWGLGFMTTSLGLGCDCLGEIAYVDAVLHDSAGAPHDVLDAEDAGLTDAQRAARRKALDRFVAQVHPLE